MPIPYFRELPNLEYINRFPGASSGEYVEVKNLFKRGKISDDIFENLMFFEISVQAPVKAAGGFQIGTERLFNNNP